MPAPSRHSAIVGGSTAARLVNCPGSVAILAKLPKSVNVTSEYAEEGQDLHTLLADMIDSNGVIWPVPGVTEIGDTLITQALMHDCIEPCWEYWTELRARLDEMSVEDEVPFPGVDGAFGTCDLSGRNERDNVTYLTDWKFGAGVGVSAVYADPEDDRYVLVNEQLLFYACGLRARYPDWFPAGVKIVLTIVQPRHQDSEKQISTVEIDNADLDDFEAEVREALDLAAKPDAVKLIGPWCRFAACKPVCPLHNGPLIDLATIESAALNPRKHAVGQHVGFDPEPIRPEDHATTLARVMNLAPIAEAIIAEARKQAHELLEAGQEIPGWKLVAKRPQRSWNQTDAETIKLLRKAPYKLLKAQCLEPDVVKSPAQIEKVLPKGVKVPSELAALASSGSTLAPADDKRPAILPKHESLKELLVLSLAAEGQAD